MKLREVKSFTHGYVMNKQRNQDSKTKSKVYHPWFFCWICISESLREIFKNNMPGAPLPEDSNSASLGGIWVLLFITHFSPGALYAQPNILLNE